MVTIKDIAQHAGVSRGTVDRVLNNRGRTSPENEALVRRIAQELGYQPNIAGKGLAARKKQLHLGFCYPKDQMAPFHEAAYQGAMQYAEELKPYSVTVEFFPWTIQQYFERTLAGQLAEKEEIDGWVVDGILANALVDALAQADKADVPVVVYNVDIEKEKRLAYVGCDYEKAGRLACGVAALMTNGAAKVGIVTQDDGKYSCSSTRISGFEKEMQENYPKMEVVARQFMDLSMDQFDFFMKVKEMLQNNPQIDVLYVVNPGDYTICQAIRRASENHEIKIITNDLVLESQREMVKQGEIAATICQEPEKQGAKPLEILFNYLALGKQPESDWYQTELSVRIRQNV